MNENGQRRCCLLSGIGLTIFGCVICALSIALPGWQLVDLPEFGAIHEHGIFYDCVRSGKEFIQIYHDFFRFNTIN